MKSIKVANLVLDFELYPRPQVDSTHVSELVGAINAGADLPPVVYDEKTKKVADGFHRVKAVMRVGGADAEIMGVAKKFKTDRELFAYAMEFNSAHGRRLTPFDRARCLIIGERLKMDTNLIAGALHVTTDNLVGLKTSRMAKGQNSGSSPLKQTIAHMRGKKLTKKQWKANDKLSGMRQSFYVEQVILLIENDLLDRSNEKLLERLQHLKGLI